MKEVVIAGGIRSPFAKSGTYFNNISAYNLCAMVLKELLYITGISSNVIDEVIIGNVANPPEAMNIARVIALLAGLPYDIPAFTVHRNCSSGMQAITTAYEKIMSGTAEFILAGGTESMSNIPFYFTNELREKFSGIMRSKIMKDKIKNIISIRPNDIFPVIGVLKGLTDPVSTLNMGQTAEVLAKEFKISRKEQDEFAFLSHRRALASIKSGRLQEEIMPIYIPPDYKQFLDKDSCPREDTNMETLGRLNPVFDKVNGTVTVGNSCPITDGACMLVVTTYEKAQSMGLPIMGTLKAFAYAGLDPKRMGLGPVFAIHKLFKKEKMGLKDIQLIEINEAFAAQIIACEKALNSKEFCQKNFGEYESIGEIDRNILNVNGGAIALGHPVGATGARMIFTLLKEMGKRNLQFGLASLCIGGGQGAALLFERK